MEKREIAEIIGGGIARGKTFEIIERLKEVHKGEKVIIVCRPEDEVRSSQIISTAGFEIAEIRHKCGDMEMPKGKSLVIINPDGEKICENLDNLIDVLGEAYRPSIEDNIQEMEEALKKMAYSKIEDPYGREHRRHEREQMKQRSRFLSKNCKK